MMTINARLALGFSTILLMMVLLTAISIHRVNFIDTTITAITDVNSVKQRYAINFRGSVHDRSIAIRDVVLARSNPELQESINDIKQLDDFYQQAAKGLTRSMRKETSSNSQELQNIAKIKQIEQQTQPVITAIINAKQSNNDLQANALLFQQARPLFVEWLAAINQFIDLQENINQAATAETRVVTSSFQAWMLGLTSAAFIIGISLAYIIAQRIRTSVGGEPQSAAKVVALIAQGDLTGQIDSCCPNSMMASVQVMQQQLKKTVDSIANSSAELSNQAISLASGSQSALSASEQQVQHTRSAVENLGSMNNSINHVADAVRQTEDNSKQTAQLSLQGKDAINKLATEIALISETVKTTTGQVSILAGKTREIGAIVSTIQGISEQTNLLALNAAIEAARAGESGRGFAVVADEVRQLAQRTRSATAEIESMINQVQEDTQASVSAMESAVPQVEQGLALTHDANDLLNAIQQQADDSLENVLEVVAATAQQVATVAEINDGVQEIASMSQDSSKDLQNNAEAADSLQQLSNNLRKHIDYFSV